MTPTPTQKGMTDLEMRIAIAESVGWKAVRIELSESNYSYQPHGWPPDDTERRLSARVEVPHYENGLNAMHEAEKLLEVGNDGSQADDYQQALWNICNPGIPFRPLCSDCDSPIYDVAYLQNFIHATARQRAEAYLRTIGKWKE